MMTIAVLQNSTEYITATLAGTPATTQPPFSVVWKSTGGSTPQGVKTNPVGLLNNSTEAKTLLTGGDSPKEVELLQIYNADTAAITVALKKVTGDGSFTLINATVPVAGTLNWISGRPPEVLNAYGTTPSDSVGAIVAGIGVTVSETGFGNFRRTILTLTDTPITITDALAYAGLKLYDFPAGRINVLDCLTSLAFKTTSVLDSTLNASSTVAYGVGSATASATTLATTMQNFMPGSGETPKEFTSSATINVAGTTVTGFLAAVAAAQLGAKVNGTGTASDVFLNVAVPTGTDIDTDATLTVSGTIEITWINGGDV